MMKRILALLLCTAMVLSLLGCDTDDTAYVPTGDGLTWDDPTAPVATSPTEAPEQHITMAYYANQSFNPLISTSPTNRTLIPLIYQGLFTVNRDYEAKPLLCEYFTVTTDMRTYVFYVHDATFSDGTPLTIFDVEATLNAALVSDVYKGRFRYVDEIRVTPDGGVMIRLTAAYENLPLLLDIPILKSTELERDRPLGTGPYRLDATVTGMELVRRRDWWCKADLSIRADTIRLISATNAVTIRDEFEFGDINLVCADPTANDYADYRCDYELWDCENGIFLYLGCNMESPVFSNEEVRSALTHAINREALATSFYRGFARGTALPVSPLSPFYNSGLAARYAYNPTLFAQAVIGATMAGSTVTLLVNKDDNYRLQAARLIGEMLTECGLTVVMSELESSRYRSALRRGSYDLYLGQTKLSPNMDLTAFFAHDGALRWGGMDNVAMFAMSQEALANRGNYYNLHQLVANDGRLTSVAFLNYAVYADRGLLSDMAPARDNIFYYDLGVSLADVKNAKPQKQETTTPEDAGEATPDAR
jgi:ABC-type transport system substrate-binding protein